MLLPRDEALLFIHTYGKLITYAARNAGGIGGITDHYCPMDAFLFAE